MTPNSAPNSDAPDPKGTDSSPERVSTFSPTHYQKLPNGLTLLLRESHRAPVVELQIWAKVGSADERAGEEGLAH